MIIIYYLSVSRSELLPLSVFCEAALPACSLNNSSATLSSSTWKNTEKLKQKTSSRVFDTDRIIMKRDIALRGE